MKMNRIAGFLTMALTSLLAQPLPSVPITAKNCVEDKLRRDRTVQPADYVLLRRTPCYGTCPWYEVTIYADGRVEWDGRQFVATQGTPRSTIPSESARSLVQRFLTADVYALCGRYEKPVSDHPTYTVEIKTEEGLKRVVDYGESAPEWFRLLRDEIDVAANTHQWRHGDGIEGLGFLTAEHLPKPGVTKLMQAVMRGVTTEVRQLIATGADLNARDSSGWTALMYASAYRAGSTVDQLLRAGADPKAVTNNGDTLLMVQALGGVFDARFVQAGVDLNAQNRDGMTALMVLASRRNPQAARAAIAAGAKIEVRDKNGHTALDYLMARDCAAPLVRGDQSFRQICLPLKGADAELARFLQAGATPDQERSAPER